MTHTEKHPLVFRAWKAPKGCLRNSSRGSQEDEAGTRRAPFPPFPAARDFTQPR